MLYTKQHSRFCEGILRGEGLALKSETESDGGA